MNAHALKRKLAPKKKRKRSKYRAKKVTYFGITFHSKKEGKRYLVLRSAEQRGAIKHLELQPDFPLHTYNPAGKKCYVGKYIADFTYYDVNIKEIVVEDVKGFKTDIYKWKKRHVEAEYGIKILET